MVDFMVDFFLQYITEVYQIIPESMKSKKLNKNTVANKTKKRRP